MTSLKKARPVGNLNITCSFHFVKIMSNLQIKSLFSNFAFLIVNVTHKLRINFLLGQSSSNIFHRSQLEHQKKSKTLSYNSNSFSFKFCNPSNANYCLPYLSHRSNLFSFLIFQAELVLMTRRLETDVLLSA